MRSQGAGAGDAAAAGAGDAAGSDARDPTARPRTITLTIGLPGAGQEAWAAATARAGAVVIDRGALRRFLRGDSAAPDLGAPRGADTDPALGVPAHDLGDDAALFRELVKYHLHRSGADVVILDLHVHARERLHMIQVVRCSDTTPHYRLIGALFTAPLALCAQRLARAGVAIASDTLASYAQALAAHDPRRERAFDEVLVIPP